MVTKQIATLDAETDPFEFGQVPSPFAWGFYDNKRYVETWGKNATQEIIAFLKNESKPLLIYAHNGGKFDFHFILDEISEPIKIINGRIAECRFGKHTLRDSFSALPLPLSSYDKGDIDYKIFHHSVRELWRRHISEYLRRDCVALFDWVNEFRTRFGNKLTIGGASIAELKSSHVTEKTTSEHDLFFRDWYQGGRVDFFAQGILKGDWKVFDVNSMYPFVMREFNHPLGVYYEKLGHSATIKLLETDRPFFSRVRAFSGGAFGIRGREGILQFDPQAGVFNVTGHELRAAIECGLLGKFYVEQCYAPVSWQNFGAFVDTFHTEKLAAKISGDRTAEMFAKLILNSAYGKFGQNPAKYRDYKIRRVDEVLPDITQWSLACDWGTKGELWERPAQNATYNDVAVAASITSAARATLLRALCASERPIYCDTDSIICEGIDAPTGKHLGQWKLECEGDTAVVIGKKLYCLLQGTEFVKYASKGVNVHPIEILDLARGKGLISRRDAPNFKFHGEHRFVERLIKPLEIV